MQKKHASHMKTLLRMQDAALIFEVCCKRIRLHFKRSWRSPAPQSPDAKTTTIKNKFFRFDAISRAKTLRSMALKQVFPLPTLQTKRVHRSSKP